MPTIATKAIQANIEHDARKEIFAALKPYNVDLEQYQMLQAECLVAVYKRPEKTRGGVFLTGNIRSEDNFQGIVGLLLKMGPLSFVDDDTRKFKIKPEVGDWLQFRPSETLPFHFGDTQCRFVEDVHVRAIVPRPDIVY